MKSNLHRESWNKGKLVGQKPPLKPKDIWVVSMGNVSRKGRLLIWSCYVWPAALLLFALSTGFSAPFVAARRVGGNFFFSG